MYIGKAYKVLELNSTSSQEEVENRYRDLIKINIEKINNMNEDCLRVIWEQNDEKEIRNKIQKYCFLVKESNLEIIKEIYKAYSCIIYKLEEDLRIERKFQIEKENREINRKIEEKMCKLQRQIDLDRYNRDSDYDDYIKDLFSNRYKVDDSVYNVKEKHPCD